MSKTNTKSTQDQPQMETCLYLSYLASKTGQTSLQYRGVHAWNGLSVDARDYSLEKFKQCLAGTACN